MKQRFRQIGLLTLLMFVFTATVFAAPNWSFVEKDEYGTEIYIDLNSISAYNGNSNLIRFIVREKPMNLYSILMNLENNQWTTFEQATFAYPGEKLVGWGKQQLRWANYDKEWPIPKVVLSHYNSRTSQPVSKPQAVGDMHFLLSRKIEQGIFEANVDLLSGESGIRSIVLTQLNQYDSGSIEFKLDNGQYVGFSVSYDGKLSFEGDGCQPREIQGGVVSYYKAQDGAVSLMKKWSFNGTVGMRVLEGGRLGITFDTPNNKRNYVVALPDGAQYLTGIVKVRNINAEVAFYK